MRYLLCVLACLLVSSAAHAQRLQPQDRVIDTDRGNILQTRQMVEIGAGQLYHTWRLAGGQAQYTVSHPSLPVVGPCATRVTGTGAGAGIYAEYLGNWIAALGTIVPPQINEPPVTCEARILNRSLSGGWHLEELTDITSDCQGGASFEIRRESDNPADMTRIIRFEIPYRSNPSINAYCTLTIGTAILSGPFGQTWNNGFN